VGDWLRRFGKVPAQEQKKQLESDPQFQQHPPENQDRLRQRLDKFNNLPEERRDRILKRMEIFDRMSPEQQKETIKEFDLKKGVGVAILSGVMSACFAYGLAAGDRIKALTIKHGTPDLWQGLPVLVVVLLGGFTTNFIWCVILNVRNKTGYQYFTSTSREPNDQGHDETIIETALDAPSREVVEHMPSGKLGAQSSVAVQEAPPARKTGGARVPMLANYLFCALAGTTWYFQFFFYSMGETQMGKYKFSSWTLHMASIIIFSSLWGIGLKEWKGAGVQAGRLLALALLLLVGSTVIVGYGNYVGLSH
jgi:L-rhamnose-H+ transport protein